MSPQARDHLLECLLVTAPRGGHAMIEVLEQLLLCHAAAELWEEDHYLGSPGSVDPSQHDVEGD